jgi:glycosyltransferase involved in cell wall biosynthesis
MRILFAMDAPLSCSDAPSSRLIYIAKSLKRKYFDVELVGRKSDEITDLETTTISGGRYFLRLILPLLVSKKTLKEKYNHIIIRGAHLAFVLLPLRILHRKIILDFHDWNFREIRLHYEKTLYNAFKIFFYYFIERTATKSSDLIVCTSKGVQSLLSREEKRKSIVLENGLDMREAEKAIKEAKETAETILEKYSIPETRSLAAFLGNWERKLDMETMLEGCKKANANLIIVGEGPNMENYRRNYKSAIFTGKLPRPEALKITSLSAVAIVPYKEDNEKHQAGYYSTRKVKDYLSLGKPILMADVSGREAFLIPNENVVLYRPKDPEDLANKMKMILSNKELKEKMQQSNLRLAREFDWQVLIEKSGLIEKLLTL